MSPSEYAFSLLDSGHTVQSIKHATGFDLSGLGIRRREFTPDPVARSSLDPAKKVVTKKMMIEREIERIANKHGVTIDEIMGDGRTRRVAYARQEIYFELYTHFEMSFPRVGKVMGRDHSTVLYGMKKHCLRYDLDYERFQRPASVHPDKKRYVHKPLSSADYARLARIT